MATVPSSKLQTVAVDIPGPDTTLVVTPDTAPLKPGKYVFALVVTDDGGLQSAQATVAVEVRNLPVVKGIKAPPIVAFGKDIPLDAVVITTGTITNFNWSVKLA